MTRASCLIRYDVEFHPHIYSGQLEHPPENGEKTLEIHPGRKMELLLLLAPKIGAKVKEDYLLVEAELTPGQIKAFVDEARDNHKLTASLIRCGV